jgi:sugar/nucleoside kinase (ribokinase family)
MEKKRDIAVIGLSCVDCIGTGYRCRWHVQNPVRDLRFSPGGLGNALTALSGLPLQVSACTRVGADPFGDYLLARWRAPGIDTEAVVRDGANATGFAFILNQDGERTPFYAAGANAKLSLDDLRVGFCEESRCALVLFAGALPSLDGKPMLEMFRHCREAGTVVILDVSDSVEADYRALASYLPYANLVVNGEEGRRLTGMREPARILTALANMAPQEPPANSFLAITRRDGILFSIQAGKERARVDMTSPFFGRPVRNVVGAGDALRAGLAAFICLHYDEYTAGRLDFGAAGLFACATSYAYLSRDRDERPFTLSDLAHLMA